jgi:hypothetical protein
MLLGFRRDGSADRSSGGRAELRVDVAEHAGNSPVSQISTHLLRTVVAGCLNGSPGDSNGGGYRAAAREATLRAVAEELARQIYNSRNQSY